MKRRVFINRSLLFCATMAGTGTLANRVLYTSKERSFMIKQFEDKGLSHFSYAILVEGKMVLIDPARDPQPYYDYAEANSAEIIAVIETHPHADFVSSHAEIQQQKHAIVYISRLANAGYPHQAFDEGDHIQLSDHVVLKAINTPGHSPDSISVLLEEKGKNVAVFTGDALLFGSVGRPDLREYSGEASTERKELAKKMYHTVHQKYALLDDDVLVYPAHGAGSLCGNAIKDIKESTIGDERAHNFAFQPRTEQEFINILLSDQPYIPEYFPYDVEVNRKGAKKLSKALSAIPLLTLHNHRSERADLIVDTRSATLFRQSHVPASVNIPDNAKFETWLGTVVRPHQRIYLVVATEDDFHTLLAKAAKIGYEAFVKGGFVYGDYAGEKSKTLDEAKFSSNPEDYVILDVRTAKEAKEDQIFEHAINIPLSDLKEQLDAVPRNRPVVVHCASGYRSSIGSSLLKTLLPDVEIYDLGEKIKQFH